MINPEEYVRLMRQCAYKASCAGDKRGAVLVRVEDGEVLGFGWNGLHKGIDCGGGCAECSKWALHAEQRALLDARRVYDLSGTDMIHGRFEGVDWALQAGRGPRCMECMKLLLEAGVEGLWLFVGVGVWERFVVEDFYRRVVRGREGK